MSRDVAKDLRDGNVPLNPPGQIVRKGAVSTLKVESPITYEGATSTSLPSEPAAPSPSPGLVPVSVNPAPAHVNQDLIDKIRGDKA
jgi:hypothetical protein